MSFVYCMLFAFLVLLTVIGKYIFKTYLNPITFINCTYLLWSFIGRLQYRGQYLPTYESSAFILACVFVIDIGIIIGYGMPLIVIGSSEKKRILISAEKAEKIIRFIRYICLIVSLAVFINLLRMLLSGGIQIGRIRVLSYSGSYGSTDYTQIYFNTLIYYFYQYFIRGFAFFDLTFSLALLLKEHKRISILTVLNFALWAFIMLSRVEILKAVILCTVLLMFSGLKLTRKQKKTILRAVVLLAVAIVIIFSFRSSSSDKGVLANSIDELIIDFSGSNYMFSVFFEQRMAGTIIKDVPYILKIFGGFGLLFEYVIAYLTGFYFDHTAANMYLTQGHSIGSSIHYNAFYTMFFDSLNTGGVLGCIFFSIIIGMIVGILFKKYARTGTVKQMYLAAYFIYIVMMGTYNYALTVPGALVIVFCIIYRMDM